MKPALVWCRLTSAVNGCFLCGLPSPSPKDACGEGACLFLGCPGVLCPEDRPSSKGPAQADTGSQGAPREAEAQGGGRGRSWRACGRLQPRPLLHGWSRTEQGRGRVGLLRPLSGTGDPRGPHGSRVVTSGRDSGAVGRGAPAWDPLFSQTRVGRAANCGAHRTGRSLSRDGAGRWGRHGRRRGAGSGRLTALPSAAWTPENSSPAAPRLDAQDSGGPQAGPAEGRLPGRLVAVSPPGLCSCGERRLASLTLVRTAALRVTAPPLGPPSTSGTRGRRPAGNSWDVVECTCRGPCWSPSAACRTPSHEPGRLPPALGQHRSGAQLLPPAVASPAPASPDHRAPPCPRQRAGLGPLLPREPGPSCGPRCSAPSRG